MQESALARDPAHFPHENERTQSCCQYPKVTKSIQHRHRNWIISGVSWAKIYHLWGWMESFWGTMSTHAHSHTFRCLPLQSGQMDIWFLPRTKNWRYMVICTELMRYTTCEIYVTWTLHRERCNFRWSLPHKATSMASDFWVVRALTLRNNKMVMDNWHLF